jgi:hypothetical protein
VARAWLREEPAPHSEALHVEGPVLLVERDMALGLRLSMRTVLVRIDLPDSTAPARQAVEEVLVQEGLVLVEGDSSLALAVAIQMVAMRMSSWDLWGIDPDMARTALEEAAAGGPSNLIGEIH